jgi:hypothetical protein
MKSKHCEKIGVNSILGHLIQPSVRPRVTLPCLEDNQETRVGDADLTIKALLAVSYLSMPRGREILSALR